MVFAFLFFFLIFLVEFYKLNGKYIRIKYYSSFGWAGIYCRRGFGGHGNGKVLADLSKCLEVNVL